ncbi:hypothetical protein ABIC28_002457 [Rhodococcus sp. PvR044]|jgi:hypothetical protein|uniref:hypothetical protein n=1 Tax=Rhodococcus TaxID=1827 RepID=UPI000BCBD656|nr:MULTISPECIES: hypothetical protein [Rhodococcus]MBP1160067.1 hypothetical protein [Rhodococcus sp. PvR099]MCZ4557094.1 hypothetical protein [Rhodococcus maanshanensis]PTR41284.1 hypothetical protein C8K38_112167 [Rhodococcus sp. OK611]SNX92106.1 hypothetical protein SAMN05447004_112167 [Rhodococcus sp. OK270]
MDRFDPASGPEVPEADHAEQETPVVEQDDADTTAEVAPGSLEVNDADAAEQARVVPDDDEYPHG